MPPRKKVFVPLEDIVASIDAVSTNLDSTSQETERSVAAKLTESKKILNDIQRLRKRRITLLNKKKRAIAANKKNSTEKGVEAVEKATSDLKTLDELIADTTVSRKIVLQELSGLKSSQRQIKVYIRAIEAANKSLAQPKRKRVRRKTVVADETPAVEETTEVTSDSS